MQPQLRYFTCGKILLVLKSIQFKLDSLLELRTTERQTTGI